jgi:hypothetical protein
LLHKIRSLSLTPNTDGTLDASLTIETLSIPTLAQHDRLPAGPLDDSQVAALDRYQVIGRRNLFRPGEPPASQMKLSAITLDVRKQRQAWLNFVKTGETRILGEGDSFTFDGSHLRIQRIEADTIQVQVDGQSRKVPIGRTLE